MSTTPSLGLILILLVAISSSAQTVTPNLGLAEPVHGAPNWDTQMNGNFNIIDNIFGIPSCGDDTHAIGWDATGKVITCQAITGGGPGNLPTATSQGQLPAATGAGNSYAAQTKWIVDVRDIAGVDCTGTTDSSTALNALWDTRLGGNINGAHIIIPSTCQIRVDHPLVIFGQSFFVIDGGGREPDTSHGAVIFGCGIEPGAVLQITRSGYADIRGFVVDAKGLSCTSAFTGSILVNNEVAGGVTAIDILFSNMRIETNRQNAHITNYVGLQIAATSAGQNTEHMKVTDSLITCNSSPGSVGILALSPNTDHSEITHNSIGACYYGIEGRLGGSINNNNLSENGSFSTYGTGGATIYAIQCSSSILMIAANETAEASGPFYKQGSGAGCPNVVMMSNTVQTPDIDTAAYVIDVATGINALTLIGNRFFAGNSLPIIGTASLLQQLSNTQLFESGNVVTGNSGAGLISAIPAQGMVSFSGSPTPSDPGRISKSLQFIPPSINPGGTQGSGSPVFTFRSNWDHSGAKDYDFVLGNMGTSDGTNSSTFYLDRILPNNASGSLGTTLPFAGGLTTTSLSWGSNTPTVTNIGSAGSTSYSYVVVAQAGAGGVPSSTRTTTTGNATLNGTNFNRIQIFPILGAAAYCVYRSASGGTPSTTGLLACYSASSIAAGGQVLYDDKGLVADSSTTPTTNTAMGGVTTASVLFANLPASANGTLIYCSDCKNVTDDTTGTFDSAAASGGHGTNVLRENGAWRVH